MHDASVYYCWVCDAHRKATAAVDGHAHCPRCQHELTADCRLPSRESSSPVSSVSTIKIAWPAPIRPRLAASA